jgi:hypothetical protein
MKKIFGLAFVLVALPLGLAGAKPNNGGGDGVGDCRYCEYNIWGKNFTCPTSTWGGRQGDGTIVYHMGEYNCREPTGNACFNGSPLPSPGPVIQ